jgi:hypothetical protein
MMALESEMHASPSESPTKRSNDDNGCDHMAGSSLAICCLGIEMDEEARAWLTVYVATDVALPGGVLRQQD